MEAKVINNELYKMLFVYKNGKVKHFLMINKSESAKKLRVEIWQSSDTIHLMYVTEAKRFTILNVVDLPFLEYIECQRIYDFLERVEMSNFPNNSTVRW